MRIADYPPQEPVPERLKFFHEALMLLAHRIEGREHSFGEDPSQSLIVYPCAQTRSPVLLFLHGGGWTNGYKEEMAFLAPPLNAAGFTLVSSSYRLAPAHVFPSNFDDVADAVAMVWGLAGTYGFDRDMLFIGGHSAGAHLASLLAATVDWQVSRGLPENSIRGCVAISGTYDFRSGSGLPARPRFLGPLNDLDDANASPIVQLRGNAAPFFIAHGAQDLPHVAMQSAKFASMARSKGVPVTTLEVDGTSHATVLLTAADTQTSLLATAVGWMRTIVNEARSRS